jgi:hypothetical protein
MVLRRWVNLRDLFILALDLRQRVRLQLLGAPIQPNEQPPGGEERRRHQPNQCCIR